MVSSITVDVDASESPSASAFSSSVAAFDTNVAPSSIAIIGSVVVVVVVVVVEDWADAVVDDTSNNVIIGYR